jgi:hypothetical protein
MRSKNSGQLLLVGTLLLLALVVTIPIIIWVHQSAGRGEYQAQTRGQALPLAEEGVALAVRVLGVSRNAFESALAAPLSDATFGADIRHGGSAPYQLSVKPAARFQVRVVSQVVTTDKSGVRNPNRQLEALVSPKTLVVQLPTDVRAPVAFQTMRADIVNPAGLDIHWGPMAVYDQDPGHTWTVDGPMDTAGYPRKFGQGQMAFISRPSLTTDTDQKEYWRNAEIGFPKDIALNAYQTLAEQNQLTARPPRCGANPCTAMPAISTVYQGGALPVLLDGPNPSNAYEVNASTVVFLIVGDAEFDDLALDLSQGAVLITGNLTIKHPSHGFPNNTVLQIPSTAAKEYPPTMTNWPCAAQGPGNTCTSAQAISGSPKLAYRGFLYVQGNLIVDPNAHWAMTGVARVDGQVQIGNGASFTLFFDEEVNRRIMTTPFELQADFTRTAAGT